MASEDRNLTATRRWLEMLTQAPGRVGFFAAVDLLERVSGGPRVGSAERHQDETLLFRHATSLGFNTGEVVSVEPWSPKGHAMTVAFFGLTGEVTPLPLTYAEEADEDDDEAEAMRGFLDLFHHRLLSLLVRGVRETDYPDTFERETCRDPWSRRLLALLGLDDASRPPHLPWGCLLRLAPILAAGTCSPRMLAEALGIALEEFLGEAQVRCEPLTGAWMPIDAEQRTRLGTATAAIGDTLVLGAKVRHPSGAARVTIGPLRGERHKAFTTGGEAFTRARELLALLVPEPVRVELMLEIEDRAHPSGRVGERRVGVDFRLARRDTSGTTTRCEKLR